jgi:hypothetical protein
MYFFGPLFVTDPVIILIISAQYNFVLSAAWSCGIAISGIIIFFALQFTDVKFEWWGNMASDMGCEGQACTLKHLAPGEYFGPRIGTFD